MPSRFRLILGVCALASLPLLSGTINAASPAAADSVGLTLSGNQFLLNGACPSARIHVVPHLVMRSNLDVFLERLPVDLAVSPSSAAPDRPLSRRLDVTSQSPRGSLPRPRRPVGSRHRA